VDRAIWGEPYFFQSLIDAGYTHVGSRREAVNASYVLKGDMTSGEGLIWDVTGTFTVGGFNDGEEENLWRLDGEGEEKKPAPELADLRITGFAVDREAGVLRIRFAFTPSNGVDVTADNVEWTVLGSSSPDFGMKDELDIATQIAAPAGVETTVEVEVPWDDQETRFYRIQAVTKETK
jgi:hypothetical protein